MLSNFQETLRNQLALRIVNDRLYVGWIGVDVLPIATSAQITGLNKGWIQRVRELKPENVIRENVPVSGKIFKGNIEVAPLAGAVVSVGGGVIGLPSPNHGLLPGAQPRQLFLKTMLRGIRLSWVERRRMLGFPNPSTGYDVLDPEDTATRRLSGKARQCAATAEDCRRTRKLASAESSARSGRNWLCGVAAETHLGADFAADLFDPWLETKKVLGTLLVGTRLFSGGGICREPLCLRRSPQERGERAEREAVDRAVCRP